MRQALTLVFLSGLLFTVTGCGNVENVPLPVLEVPLVSSTTETVNTSTLTTTSTVVVSTSSPIIVPSTSTLPNTTTSNSLLKRVESISKTLKEKGIANKYKNISEPMDVGARYVFTFEASLSDYKLFVMESNFVLGVGEGGPTSFTPKKIDFSATQNAIVNQLIKPGSYKDNNIQYSKKVDTTFWIFGDFGYAVPNYFVQALAKDSAGFGYLLHVDVLDSKYINSGNEAIDETKNNTVVQKILSVVVQ